MTEELFGLTPEARYYIDAAAEKAAEAAVAKFVGNPCPFECRDVGSLKRTVYGAAEDGVVGMDERMNRLEAFEARVTRLTWLVVAQLVVLIGIAVTTVVTFG